MTEDVELTRKILELYADEEKWPSCIGSKELRNAFPGEPLSRLTAHVVWAADAGMFKGETYRRISHSKGTQYKICRPDGLSKIGSDYINYARSSLWDKAKKKAQEQAIPLTTQLVSKILPQLAEQQAI